MNNNITGAASFVGGGRDNEITGADYAAIPGGYDCRLNASTADYGTCFGLNAQPHSLMNLCHGSGQFSTRGDAITEEFTVRRQITHVANTWYDLLWDGSTGSYTPSPDRTDCLWNIYVQIVGLTAGAAKRWAYNIKGLVVNDGGSTSILVQSKTVLYESDTSYDVQLATTGFSRLGVQVRTTSATDTIKWVARGQVASVEQ